MRTSSPSAASVPATSIERPTMRTVPTTSGAAAARRARAAGVEAAHRTPRPGAARARSSARLMRPSRKPSGARRSRRRGPTRVRDERDAVRDVDAVRSGRVEVPRAQADGDGLGARGRSARGRVPHGRTAVVRQLDGEHGSRQLERLGVQRCLGLDEHRRGARRRGLRGGGLERPTEQRTGGGVLRRVLGRAPGSSAALARLTAAAPPRAGRPGGVAGGMPASVAGPAARRARTAGSRDAPGIGTRAKATALDATRPPRVRRTRDRARTPRAGGSTGRCRRGRPRPARAAPGRALDLLVEHLAVTLGQVARGWSSRTCGGALHRDRQHRGVDAAEHLLNVARLEHDDVAEDEHPRADLFGELGVAALQALEQGASRWSGRRG